MLCSASSLFLPQLGFTASGQTAKNNRDYQKEKVVEAKDLKIGMEVLAKAGWGHTYIVTKVNKVTCTLEHTTEAGKVIEYKRVPISNLELFD